MAVDGSALAELVKAKVDLRMSAVRGFHPLGQKNPSYYIEMCTAIGAGIILGGPAIQFQTEDNGKQGAPAVAGTGIGQGIITDPSWFVQDLYSRARSYIQADFGKTMHDAYPPSAGNSGNFLLALCEGINDAILQYYPIAWTLASVHPQIYDGSGVINQGNFSGLSAPAIKSAIMGLAPRFHGKFWPRLVQAISESYVELIHQHSTGQVTISGSCSDGPTQVCNLPGSGSGTGTAT